jgi:biopolymer transport protein ExbD
MGMDVGGSKGGAKSDINVTPLVDVCLVLLIIFMVLVPMNVPEISVRIPPESKQRNPSKNEALVIGLTKDGGLTLNRNPVSRESLGEMLKKQLEFREKKAIFVDFDDDAEYGVAVEILDVAKQAGAEVLGIMKKRDRKTPDNLHGV